MYSINQKFFKKLNDKLFYGWIIVGIGSLGIFASGAGQSHTFSPFIPVISKDLKISSTSITTAYMIATLFAAFLLPARSQKLSFARTLPFLSLFTSR